MAKKLESTLTNMVLVLTGVAVIMGGILAYVNHLTEGPINDQKAKALADGIKTVMCVSNLQVSKTDTVRRNDAKASNKNAIIRIFGVFSHHTCNLLGLVV